MKKHTNKNLRRGLALFMTVLMMLSCFTAGFSVISFAAGASAPLLGRYFSTPNPWYDAVTNNGSGLGWIVGTSPSYDAVSGYTYLNPDSYLKINNTSLFSGVSASTGLTVAFTYKPNAGGNYRHLLSFGANDASNINKHLYISSNPSHVGGGTQVPVIGYVDGNGAEHINAYPSNGPAFATGETYEVMISISATEITYLINGALCTTACNADSATYLTQFLNEVSGYQNNFIGRSRWGDSSFDGSVKDIRIYGAALLEKDSLIAYNAAAFDSTYGSTNLTANLTQSNAANQFNAVAYHTTNEATGAYSNLVYAPYNQTNFVGENGDYKEIGAIYFKIITPSNIVMVYDGAHDVYSPIEIETKKHDKAAVSNQAIRYVESQSGILPLAHYWYGYQDGGNNNEYMLWAGPRTENWFSHVADGSWDVGQDNKNTPRFWWNKVQYAGTGNTTSYYEHVQNLGFNVSSPFDNWGYKDGYGDITSESNYFVINYKPVYDALPYALACYNEMTANGWMYTDESIARAKATLYQMLVANPKHSDYNYAADASAATVACAANITRAVNLLGSSIGGTFGYEGLNLVKKTGTITFADENGTTLQTETANYGDTITIIEVPTKASTAEYDYTNPVWVPAATPGSAVMSDTYNQTFTASYTPVKRSYTITWRNVDHTLIDTTTVLYGETPGHATPTVPASYDTEHYTYAFTGWTPEVAAVTGDATYIATFSATPNNYTITWQYEDGTLIDTTSVAYGTMPTHADPALPASADTDHYTYAFTGWTPEIDVVSGTATYTATFSETPNNYTITWYNADGSLIDTTTVPYNGTPAHATPSVPASYDTTHYTYTFDGWNPSLATVTGDAEYTAQFTAYPKSYTITWNYMNAGGGQTITETYEYGATPTVPTAATNDYVVGRTQYSFNGWDAEVSSVTGSATYTAQYTTSTLPAATATMYANDINPGVYQNVISYTIFNLTTGSSFNGDTCGNGVVQYSESYDSQAGQTVYRKSWQANDTESRSTGILEVDRSKYDDIFETGIYIDSIFWTHAPNTNMGRYGIELFDGTGSDKGALGDSAAQVTLTDSSGDSYTYKLCDSSGTEIGSAPYGSMENNTTSGDYQSQWYIKGAAPAVGESVTLRVLAICTSNAYTQNLQMLSEWTDITITGVCTHSHGFTQEVATDDYLASGATCQAKAKYYKSCPDCGAAGTETFEVGDYGAHTLGDLIPAAPAETCAETGTVAYYHCSVCGKNFSDAAATNELSSLDDNTCGPHNYGVPTYEWTDDYSSVTATRVCSHNAAHTETETVDATQTSYHPATCSATGLAVYQSEEFNNPAFAQQINPVTLAIDEDAHYYSDTYSEIIRPVKDEATGEWGKGTLVYYCLNTTELDPDTGEITGRDQTHDKEEEVDRADYTAYDAAAEAIAALNDLDLNLDYVIEDEDEEYTLGELLGEIEEILADIPQDYVEPEQEYLDELVPDLLAFINEFNSLIDELGDDAFNHYEIKFVNTDGTVLDTQSLKKGDAVVYGGDDPVCPDNDAQYTYAFTGWDTEIAAVTGAATYTATYDMDHPTTNTYTITWVDAGDPEMTTVAYGETPAHDLPTRDDDEYYTYSFAWDPELAPVTGEASYMAVQSKTWNQAKQAIINTAGAIIADANDPDNGDDYDPEYIEDIQDLLDVINDETKSDEERKEALDVLEELTGAVDQHKYYTVTFVTDGSAVTAITELYGTEVTLPDSEKDGFHFEGWYADSEFAADSKVTSPYTLTGDVTLYAFFEELSLDAADVEAAIATATAGVSGICYTAQSYSAYTDAVAAVRAFKDQPATAENLTAYNNALSDLDAAVAALVVEHAYTGDPTLIRPVKDADTGEWGTGTYTWTCANDAGHPVKTEPVNRANYTQYDAVLAQINTLLEEDYTDNVINALTTAKTATEAIQQDYVVPEQGLLDAAIQTILNTLGENDKITVNEDGVITVSDDAYKTYTLTVSNNVNSSTLTYTKKAGEQVVLTLTLAGYTFKSWSENANLNAETGVYTFPAADDTITALYVKDLTGNQTIAAAEDIITDANDPDNGSDYDEGYIGDLEDLLDELDEIKDDPTKLDEVEQLLEDIQELVDAADSNKLYTITWVIDGASETTKVKVGETPTHAEPTKEGFHFTGWDPAIVAVTGDATYTAQFEENATGDADYEEYDTLFAILEVLKDNDAILPDLLEQINDKVDNPLPRDLTADQQDIIDAEVEAIKALLDQIVEKDGNGNYTTSVKESALVHCTVTFYWLTTKLTKTVIKGDPVAAPNVTAMYGVEGMESGHYVFDKWTIKGSDSTDFDLESIAGDLELEGHYKLEAHTGSWVEHPATCSSVSWHEIDCTTCGMHFKANTGTEKAPHDWNDWVVVEATCAHPGSRTRTCQNDPSHKETEIIPQLSHTDANNDTICDVCGNPTENHQHTDNNGDNKCDTCGASVNIHVHNDYNNDGVCDGCGSNMDGSFRCNMCSFYEQYRSVPVFGWFVTAVHFFYHLIAQITSWR